MADQIKREMDKIDGNGDRYVTRIELARWLNEHHAAHHDSSLKMQSIENRTSIIEEKLGAAIATAKWAIPLALMLAAILEHAIVSFLVGRIV